MSIHHEAAAAIRKRQSEWAEEVVSLQYQRQPDFWPRFGETGRLTALRDAGYHITYLAEAVQFQEPMLFLEYLSWAKVLFAGLKFPDSVLPVCLECLRSVLKEKMPPSFREPVLSMIDDGLAGLTKAPSDVPTFIVGDEPLDRLARRFLGALMTGDRRSATKMILEAVESGTSVRDLYLHVFQRTQREIGRLWQSNRISVAQEHFCTAATQTIMSQLYPYIFSGERKDRRLVVCCVGNELHEIGARMVADFMEMEGWDTYFLGANTPTESVLHAVEERRADVLAVSATMTFHVDQAAELIATLRQSRLAKTPVLVGGYPFNISAELWRKIGADGYAPDAQRAATEAERLIAA